MDANTLNVTTTNQSTGIQVSQLVKQFERPGDKALLVINNVSFTVEPGELVAIVGPSGCGKSTLLEILSGAESKTSGTITFNPPANFRTATIEQAPALLPWRTAFQNACLGAEVRGPFNDVVVERVGELFAEYGLKGFENHYPSELSGGMQQR